MQKKRSRKYEQQGGCNRRVVNKGLSQRTQQAMRDAEYRRELKKIDDDYSLWGLFQ